MTQGSNLRRRGVLKTLGGIGTAIGIGGVGLVYASQGAEAAAGTSISDPSAITSDDGEIRVVATKSTGRLRWDGFDTPAAQARILVDVVLKRSGSTLNSYRIHDTGAFSLDADGDGTGGPWGGDGDGIGLSGDHEAGQSGYIASDSDWGILQQDRAHIYDPESEETLSDGALVDAGNGYPLPENPAPTDPLTADSDGGTQKTKVVLKATYILYDSNGNELTGSTGYPDRPVAKAGFTVTVNNEEGTTSFGGTDNEGDSDDGATVFV